MWTEEILKNDMHKNGKWLFREHTSCSTGDGDGDGDGDGEGNGVDEGDGRGDGDGDDDADADGDGEVARSILGDSKGDEVTEDIEESLKKNVNQDHIIQKNCLTITLRGQNCGRKGE